MLHTFRETGGAGEVVEGAVGMLTEEGIWKKKLYRERIGLSLVGSGREKSMGTEVRKGDARVEHSMTELVSAGEALLRFGERLVYMDEFDAFIGGAAAPRPAEVAEEHVDPEALREEKGVIGGVPADEGRRFIFCVHGLILRLFCIF